MICLFIMYPNPSDSVSDSVDGQIDWLINQSMSRVPEVITDEVSSHATQTYGTTKASQENTPASSW
jgi:hypothetical protein